MFSHYYFTPPYAADPVAFIWVSSAAWVPVDLQVFAWDEAVSPHILQISPEGECGSGTALPAQLFQAQRGLARLGRVCSSHLSVCDWTSRRSWRRQDWICLILKGKLACENQRCRRIADKNASHCLFLTWWSLEIILLEIFM